MIRTIRTSAHQLDAIPDGSVQAVITSPPYYGLRSYAGEQDVEWPTVTYRLNEWCEPVTVQGCADGCVHEWVDGPMVATGRNDETPEEIARRFAAYGTGRQKALGSESPRKATQGRYCLRCGGWRGPLGLEPSPVAYIGHLILCLREWRRVLRDDGVCFVNLGDSYAGSSMSGGDGTTSTINGSVQANRKGVDTRFVGKRDTGLKPKDILGIPWMFAFAARADGWWLRSDIIWAKPNPMPESVTDRPTKAHEYIFVLAKSARYFWDAEAVREDKAPSTVADPRTNGNGHRRDRDYTGAPSNGGTNLGGHEGGRNIRTVWTIATAPYPGAHYAVFPPKLVEPMIRAATSERGCCPNCGAPWRRVVDAKRVMRHELPDDDPNYRPGRYTVKANGQDDYAKGGGQAFRQSTTIGWQPACACDADDPVPCTVLDPFAGSGTTGRVAASLGRAAILCDVSGEYLEQHVPERTTVQIGLPQL